MALPIRLRLGLVAGLLVAALIAGLGAFVYLRLEADLLEAVDDGLRARAETLSSAWADRPSADVLTDAGDAFSQVLSEDGRVLATSTNLPRDVPLPPPNVTSFASSRTFEMMVRTIEEPILAHLVAKPMDAGEVLVVGASVEDQRDALDDLRGSLLVTGPVAVALAGFVGWLIAGAALRPVERMRVAAEAVSASEPGRRLPVSDAGDELARLGASLNRMLERLETAAAHERRFVNDASHELRTPLANLKAELDLALGRSRTHDELVDALGSAAEETDRLSRLAEDLLVLAREDGGRLPIRREPVDIGEVARETVGSFATRAQTIGTTLEVRVRGVATANADASRIRQAVGNLVDNALVHAGSQGSVAIEVVSDAGWVSTSVTDTGPGFSESFLPHVFEPFSRADAARSRDRGGAGLGLAIVKAVAEAHGGSVEARNRQDGPGAEVILRIRS